MKLFKIITGIFALLIYSLSIAQQIEITADEADFQEIAGVSVYRGNAKLTEGTNYMLADKIKILHPENEIKTVIISGKKGKQLYMRYGTKNSKIVEGWANNLNYDVKNEIIVLTGNAKVKQNINYIKASRIMFNKKKGRINAVANKKGRVTTVFEIKEKVKKSKKRKKTRKKKKR